MPALEAGKNWRNITRDKDYYIESVSFHSKIKNIKMLIYRINLILANVFIDDKRRRKTEQVIVRCFGTELTRIDHKRGCIIYKAIKV